MTMLRLSVALTVLLTYVSCDGPNFALPMPVLSLPGLKCSFEDHCAWRWNTSVSHPFRVITGPDANATFAGDYDGPFADASNNTHGHFLYLRVPRGAREYHISSPRYTNTGEKCRVELMLNMINMAEGNFKIVVESVNASWVVKEIVGNSMNRWEKYNFTIGRVTREFGIIVEIVTSSKFPSQVAVDDLKLLNCFPEAKVAKACTSTQFRCSNNKCIDKSELCDLSHDCLYGEDEEQDCDKVPFFSRCDFEDGWCGWTNGTKHLNGQSMNWTRHRGSTPTSHTGPEYDHTYGNDTGTYVFVDMSVKKMGAPAILESVVFNRPPPPHSNVFSPYYNSCHIRFHYHKYGPHSGSLALFLVEVHPIQNRTSQLWWSFGDKGSMWMRQVVVLPNVTSRYFFQFEARKGYASRGDIALDDISMSPECFGIGIPLTELGEYNYTAMEKEVPASPMPSHKDFVNKTSYLLGTCGVKGRVGPLQANCSAAYNNTTTRVVVLEKLPYVGVQEWVVPEGGYYTLIAKGAKGGQGSDGKGASMGAIARTVVELHKGQRLYVLVGQKGTSACSKMNFNVHNFCRPIQNTAIKHASKPNPIRNVLKFEIEDGGGGGGGGTFIFLMSKDKPKPLLVAAGGGGLGLSPVLDDRGLQHGQGENISFPPTSGNITGNATNPMQSPAGPGGGWSRNNLAPWHNGTGEALLQGAKGGFACRGDGWGGFGGGGGGCLAGGGGGGFTGGDASSNRDQNGRGGFSYAGTGTFKQVLVGTHDGEGAVHIIPAIAGCQCDYRCVALDEFKQKTGCLCPSSWYLGKDGFSCILPPEPAAPVAYVIALTSLLVFISLAILCICLYSRYQRKREERMTRRFMHGPDLQLNRLRAESNSIMTEYNPNYEFGGATYTIRDLKDIPRDHLRLVKALGQGAFGEVYQGFFRHRDGDAVEMPVAVKVGVCLQTLPELSTNQAETDFLMEALIMSKFNHPNIVHFIGVCFDKHPRFIVLELLAGGDLKTFLRESRPKPERPSPLLMKDLLLCSMDVAKGCKYMEDNRFIHRDIAARNCLLTTKGPGRVVKIADFGMARDIYRADYYRKGGKAMLPIKWMPPEAFLDGIFTTKTDVWSFGVLLWEVMSLGYMPYTGCANRDVMQLVTSGGRLEPPSNCPGPLYGIMTQCWHPKPEERPTFATILERLDYCIQDPDVVNAPLPVFYRPPSAERDATIMRPPASENSCLQVQRNADYLVPLPCVLPELPSSPSANSVDKLLANGIYEPDTDWETSFVIPESHSTQPLLETEGSSSSDATDKTAVVGSLVSLEKTPTNHNNNNNNNNINPRNTLKVSLSLDPATLTKQPLPYVNVKVAPTQIAMNSLEPAVDTGRAFTVQGAAKRHLHSDTEISC